MPLDLVASRFWTKVNKTDGCWLWTASQDRHGYGVFKLSGRLEMAHRVAWILTHDQVPDGAHVLHRCDTPLCVCPEHLFIGTHRDNMLDKEAKERGNQPHGEKNGRSVLTEEDVINIRSAHTDGVAGAALARRYGVSRTAVRKIIVGTAWQHI